MKRKKFGIRGRVLASFFILAAMVVVSGALSVHKLRQASREAHTLVQRSYEGVRRAQGMLDALEGEREVLLRYVAGGWASRSEAELVFARWRAGFSKSLGAAQADTMGWGNRLLLDSLSSARDVYTQAALALLQEEAPTFDDYTRLVGAAQQRVKRTAGQLLSQNQEELHSAMRLIETFPERSFRPGLLIMAVFVLFSLMFFYLISVFYIRPVLQMRDAAEGYLRYRDRVPFRLTTYDELQELWQAIERLMERCDETEGRRRGV